MRIFTRAVYDIETGALLESESYDYSGPLALADRSAQGQATQAANTAGTTGANFGSQASQINSTILPTLERNAQNPTGFSPTDLNNMTVASEQGAGGANSGITGQANLQAARTRNAGGFGSALDEAARDKTRTLSSNALGVQNQNANLKNRQQQSAIGTLSGMGESDNASMLKAMGLQDQAISTEVQAGNSGWLQNFNQVLASLSGNAKTAATAGAGG